MLMKYYCLYYICPVHETTTQIGHLKIKNDFLTKNHNTCVCATDQNNQNAPSDRRH